jgi:hypothetical protein
MTYDCNIDTDYVLVYLNNKLVGKFDVEEFLIYVISPLEFSRFEKNPDKRKFNIRKFELNHYNKL